MAISSNHPLFTSSHSHLVSRQCSDSGEVGGKTRLLVQIQCFIQFTVQHGKERKRKHLHCEHFHGIYFLVV